MQLELAVRGAAVGAFTLLALCMVRGPRTPARLIGALFCLAAGAHTITQSPLLYASLGLAFAPVSALSLMGAGLFWAFALELFEDHQNLTLRRLAPAALLLTVGTVAMVAPPPLARIFWLAQNLIGAVLLVHVLAVVWTGWRGDLVETRRRLRGPLLAIAALYALVVVAVQSVELFSRPANELSLLAALSLVGLGLAGSAVFLRADTQLFGSGSVRPAGAAAAAALDPALLGRLRTALDEQELWRLEGLTIGSLAARLGAPEHHLRRLINEGLGYRNFAAFINERRITEAKRALADPENLRTPVASIAFEMGFASLGPFNRTFREATGLTPTAWRRATSASASSPASAVPPVTG